jgi:hypothetical protein
MGNMPDLSASSILVLFLGLNAQSKLFKRSIPETYPACQLLWAAKSN